MTWAEGCTEFQSRVLAATDGGTVSIAEIAFALATSKAAVRKAASRLSELGYAVLQHWCGHWTLTSSDRGREEIEVIFRTSAQ